MNWAEETWQATKESQIHLLLPWPVPPFQHHPLRHRGGCPPHANACGTQVQAADAVMKILQKVKDSGLHPDLIISQS